MMPNGVTTSDACSDLRGLRDALKDGLADALFYSGGGVLDREDACQAAASVVGGEGLPEGIAARFGKRPVCALVCLDADRIHSWVFASERVQVAGGASATLKDLNAQALTLRHDRRPGIHGPVYSAGGGGVLFASLGDVADLPALEDLVRQALERPGRDLTFTVAALPLYARDLASSSPTEAKELPEPLSGLSAVGGVRGVLVRLQVLVREAKEARPRVRPLAKFVVRPGLPLDRCPSCGRKPPSSTPVTDSTACWCRTCQGLRDFFRETVGEGLFVAEDGTPITFSDFAEAIERPRRFLGFIAIDGNGMGNLVQKMGGFLELRAFSEAVTAIYDAARQTVGSWLTPFLTAGRNPESCHLSLLSGGDEITLVLPAAAAPVVTLELLRAIEQGFSQATLPGGLLHEAFKGRPEALAGLSKAGAGAGLILAQPTYPVRLLRRYADELLKVAKTTCVERGLRSAVAWHFLTDSSPLPTGLDHGVPGYSMSLEDLSALLEEVHHANDLGVPRSALQRLLAQHRDEEMALRSIRERKAALNLLDANFFRYQLARNAKLADWWKVVSPQNGGSDPVHEWLGRSHGRKLEQVVDLLSLEGPSRGEATP